MCDASLGCRDARVGFLSCLRQCSASQMFDCIKYYHIVNAFDYLFVGLEMPTSTLIMPCMKCFKVNNLLKICRHDNVVIGAS